MKNRISSIMDTRKKKASFVLVGLVLVLVMATGLVFAANGESYRDFDFDDLDPAFYVPAQPAHSTDLYAPAVLSDDYEWQVLYDSVGNMLLVFFDGWGNKWLHHDSVGMEWFQYHTEWHYYVDDFGNIHYYTQPIVIDGWEWSVLVDIDGNPFLSQLPPRPVNGMIYSSGIDANGNEVIGWVRETDLMAGRYAWLSPEEQFQVQLEQARRFYETGEYWLFINLYSDTNATEVIGKHKVIVYPDGQAAVHGFGDGVIYIDGVED